MCNVEIIDRVIDTLKIVEAQNKTQGECIKTLTKMVKLQTDEIASLTKRATNSEAEVEALNKAMRGDQWAHQRREPLGGRMTRQHCC